MIWCFLEQIGVLLSLSSILVRPFGCPARRAKERRQAKARAEGQETQVEKVEETKVEAKEKEKKPQAVGSELEASIQMYIKIDSIYIHIHA